MPTIGTNLTGPPLNATGGDPNVTPPPPPPTDASNHPDDQAKGIPGEMQAEEQAAITNARTGRDQAPPLEESTDKPAEPVAETPPAETKPAAKPIEERDLDDVLADDKTPGWQKREIAKERTRRREETTARAAAEKKAADLEAEIAALKEAAKPPPPPKPEIAPDPPRPTRDQFDSPDAYDTAIENWATTKAELAAARTAEQVRTDAENARIAAEQEAKAKTERETREAEEARVRTEMEALQKSWSEQRTAAIEKYPDFVGLVEKAYEEGGPRITPIMAHAALQLENGAEVAYHLAKNRAEGERIAGLPDARQWVEIGRLSQRLASPPAPRVEFPAEPITPLRASREAATDTDREESMDEVAARVARREADRRTGMWGQRTAMN